MSSPLGSVDPGGLGLPFYRSIMPTWTYSVTALEQAKQLEPRWCSTHRCRPFAILRNVRIIPVRPALFSIDCCYLSFIHRPLHACSGEDPCAAPEQQLILQKRRQKKNVPTNPTVPCWSLQVWACLPPSCHTGREGRAGGVARWRTEAAPACLLLLQLPPVSIRATWPAQAIGIQRI